VLLWFVDVDEGRRAAREAQAAIGVDNPGSPAAAADGGTQS